MGRKGFPNLVVYLDDFLLEESSFDRCQEAQRVLLGLLRTISFAIDWEKVEGPTQILTFLGVELDSIAYQLRLPRSKLGELRQLEDSLAPLARISLRQLQGLAGKLNWISHVIFGGRTYLRRILDAMKPLREARHKVKITEELRCDLKWWSALLERFNGVRLLHAG